jgi:hypothetical protein
MIQNLGTQPKNKRLAVSTIDRMNKPNQNSFDSNWGGTLANLGTLAIVRHLCQGANGGAQKHLVQPMDYRKEGGGPSFLPSDYRKEGGGSSFFAHEKIQLRRGS